MGQNPSTTPAQNSSGTASNYLLRSGDLIRITVFQEDDLTTEVRIPDSGQIMFPLIGAIKVQGKSVAEVQEMIRSLLAKKYIVNPQITAAVLDYAKLWLTVLGEVRSPGNVQVTSDRGMDLLAAIALAQGFTSNADSNHVNIRRRVNNQDVVLNVDATALSRDSNAKPCMVLPGDVVTVPYVKRWLTVMGEVKSPGKIDLPTEGGLDLLGALALAGGCTSDADPNQVEIRRNVDGHDTVLTVSATRLARDPNVKPFAVLAGDTISVKYAKLLVTILGQVKSPGSVKILPDTDTDLLAAVALAGGFTELADISHISVRRSVKGKDVVLIVDAKKLSHDSSVGAFVVQPGDSINVPERMF